MTFYAPDFDSECRICGTTPCVTVLGHKQPDTELCGRCFFQDKTMLSWELWNDQDTGDSDE